jgi:1-aminocyclopropane-1-carboxylate deaminase/D-cysteine desulfhydrase-like pyridoxal-dependent ACC family enzyme
VVASSSGGTQAGLVLGAMKFSFAGQILGISIDRSAAELREIVHRLAHGSAERLDLEIGLQPEQILINDEYRGGGYGVMDDQEQEAIRLFASHAGLLLDPVYTGRAAGALIDLARKGFFTAGQTVLFWHTGGSPALFASQYQKLLSDALEW